MHLPTAWWGPPKAAKDDPGRGAGDRGSSVKAAPFEYRRPESLEEALEILAGSGDEAKPIAGGQSLVPLMAMRLARPAVLVDLDRIDRLKGLRRSGTELRIGAMTTEADVERSNHVPAFIRQAVSHIGHFQIRNRGTVGGSLVHADPAAEWPALATATDSRLVLESKARGRREVAAADFFLGPLMTALEPDEVLVEVVIPNAHVPGAFAEVERRSGDFALVGAVVHGSAVVVFGAGSRPQRLVEAEGELWTTRDRPELMAAVEAEIEAVDDIHASANYRRRVGARLVIELA